MKTAILLPLLLSSSLVLAAQDSSIHAKNIEMKAEEQATAIIQTGDGKIIGETGDFIKELRTPKSGGIRNSSISAGENLTIKATGKGVVIVQTGNGTIVYQANKQAVAKLGVAEKSLASFFAILQVEDVPLQDWDKKLEEIAENYQRLKTQVADIQTDDQAIADLKQQAETAIDKGQFNTAKALLDKAETLAMDSHIENRLITAADIAASEGALANFQLQYQLAGESYEDAASKIAALGDEHYVKWSEYLNWAGMAFQNAGQYMQALPFLEKAYALREKYLPANHLDVAISMDNLASLYREQGQYDKAQPLHERSLGIMEKVLSKEHPDVATSLNNLALLYYAQGQYDKAQPLLERSLGISEKVLGKNHPDIALSLNNLALLYKAQGQYDKAQPLYERSLGIWERVLGKDHPNVATSLNNLAMLYYVQGQYDKAQPLYERSLGIGEKALGKAHPNVAGSLNNLAELYYVQGQYDKAQPLYERSLEIWEKVLGKEHPDVATSLNNLAGLYYAQGQYDKAQPLLERSLGIREKVLGKDHPSTKIGRENYEILLEKMKQVKN